MTMPDQPGNTMFKGFRLMFKKQSNYWKKNLQANVNPAVWSGQRSCSMRAPLTWTFLRTVPACQARLHHAARADPRHPTSLTPMLPHNFQPPQLPTTRNNQFIDSETLKNSYSRSHNCSPNNGAQSWPLHNYFLFNKNTAHTSVYSIKHFFFVLHHV